MEGKVWDHISCSEHSPRRTHTPHTESTARGEMSHEQMCERRRGGRFFMHRRSFSRARAKAACRHKNSLQAVERLSAPLLQMHPQNGRRPVTFLQVTCVNMSDAFKRPHGVDDRDVLKMWEACCWLPGCSFTRRLSGLFLYKSAGSGWLFSILWFMQTSRGCCYYFPVNRGYRRCRRMFLFLDVHTHIWFKAAWSGIICNFQMFSWNGQENF